MKKLIIISIICILVLSSFCGCFEEEKKNNKKTEDDPDDVNTQLNVTTSPFLWKIEGDTPSYLYGTVHLREIEILTLPDIVFELILSSDMVFTEVKMDYSTLRNSTLDAMLPAGVTVDDLLSDDVLQKLDDFFSGKNLSQQVINVLKTMKVWAVASAVVQYSDSDKEDENQPTLDQYIWNMADENGVNVFGLERAEEQLGIFDGLTLQEQIQYLNDSLDYVNELEDGGQYYVDLFQNEYLKGDLDSMLDLQYADFDENDPLDQKLEKLVLTDRNINMTSRIIDNITKNPGKQFFFVVGAAHYFDENGIISLLEDEGYTVSRVSFDKCTSCDLDETNINGRCYFPYSDKYETDFT